MILGVGFDIVDLARFRTASDPEEMVAGILTPWEAAVRAGRRDDRACAMAFATKEALMKALGCGLSRGWRWKDIEVHAGTIRLKGHLRAVALGRGVKTIRTARACTPQHALACVVIEGASHQGGAH